MFKVIWTGSYPTLCFGEWEISYNGKKLNIPEDIRESPMNTHGTYQKWHFEDWMEVFEDYESGQRYETWVNENKDWITKMFKKGNVPNTEDNFLELYVNISKEDWRHNSCGGCI